MKHFQNNRTIGLTIARVLLSLIVLKDLILYFLYSEELLGKEGIVSFITYIQLLELSNLDFLFINFADPFITNIFLGVAFLSTLSFLYGYRVKLSGLILFFCLFTIRFRALYAQDGADNVMLTMVPLLLLASTYNLYTGKLNNNFKHRALQMIPILAGVGILYEFCLIYFGAGLSKILQPVWQNGEALYYILRIEDFRASNLNIYLTENAFFVKTATWGTLFWELTFPFAIWFSKKIRNWYLVGGIALHIGIWTLMRIDNFSFIMLSFYPVFFFDYEFKAFYERYLKKWFGRFKDVQRPQLELLPKEPVHQSIILFDGDCNLCNRFVQFVLDHDKKEHYTFSSLQSPLGQEIQHTIKLDASKLDSILLYHSNGEFAQKSTAALNIFASFGGFWQLFKLFQIVPVSLRDMIYDWVARHRYTWFGQSDHCRIPTQQLNKRFIS